MDKNEIARILEEISTLLEIKGENPFKVRAYQNAARAILNAEKDLDELVQNEQLIEVPGIGESIAEKIEILLTTGRLPFYEKLKKSLPSGLLELMQLQGLGPKKIKILYKKLKIKSISALKKACTQGKIATIKGFGKKSEKNILDAISHRETYAKRTLWWRAMEVATPILKALQKLKSVQKAEIAGSLRRKLETVGDLDFLVASSDPKSVMKWFTSQSFVARVLAQGETKAQVRLEDGIQADLRIVSEKEFGFALCYFTGSKEHNIELRERAVKKKWSLSEYGLETRSSKHASPFLKGNQIVTEEDLYQVFGLSYIPPELREHRGEFEAAAKGKLPKLIEDRDIRGTLHNHTTASDGRNTLKEMISAAEELGWEYIGITDHSQASFQAGGQTEEKLLKQVEEIRKINASKKYNLHVFSSVECDILPNGHLDFSDAVLKKLDYVVASVHSSLNQDEKTMTKRFIRAIEHPSTTIIGHVTGRLLLRREASHVNLTKVIDACIANGKIMELNGNPQRLDLDWRYWHKAAEKGLKCCINADAHSVQNLEFFRSGVNSARKGWLEKENVINTLSLKDLQKILKKMHP